MEHRDRSRSLADDELLAGLSRIVSRRNQITAEFLAYLAELDQRQLFLDLGYPSLLPLLRHCARAVRVDGGATHRGGASVPLLPASTGPGRARRLARICPQRDEEAPHGRQRGPALRVVYAQEHATGRTAPCRAIPEARRCGLDPSLAHTQCRESGCTTSAPDAGGLAEE